jgi:hypothetical protein
VVSADTDPFVGLVVQGHAVSTATSEPAGGPELKEFLDSVSPDDFKAT